MSDAREKLTELAETYDARTALKEKGLVYEGGDERWFVKHT
jgi:hypothetical protein